MLSFCKALFLLLLPVLAGIYIMSEPALLDLLTGNIQTPPQDFGSGAMFDQIANRYDFINRVLAVRMDVGWRKQMVKEIKDLLMLPQPQSSYKLLDLATGTADVALQLAKDIDNAQILGLDPSNNMLEIGRQKVKQQAELSSSSSIDLQQADARDMSAYASNSFDAATMSFGIRNVPTPRETALCEIHRLLKPNGILGILEFSTPDDSHGMMGQLARLFILHVVPVIGGVLSGKPREYLHLQNSIQDFPSPEKFHALLSSLNCPGAFSMQPVQHLNFGSVQLYIGRAIKPPPKKDPVLPPLKATATNEEQHQQQ